MFLNCWCKFDFVCNLQDNGISFRNGGKNAGQISCSGNSRPIVNICTNDEKTEWEKKVIKATHIKPLDHFDSTFDIELTSNLRLISIFFFRSLLISFLLIHSIKLPFKWRKKNGFETIFNSSVHSLHRSALHTPNVSIHWVQSLCRPT